jgi:FtsH-binding integral membrane protein
MAQYDNRARVSGTRSEGVIDQGLRAYMSGVYNYMAGGVALTGVVAFALFSLLTTNDASLAAAKLRNGVMLTEMGKSVYGSPFWMIVAFAPLAFILFMSFARTSTATAQMMFWAFAGVMGLSMSTIFIKFTGQSIVQMFFVTSAAFAGLSLYGYTTKKDLSGWGSFLIMGVIGIIIASIVNIFLQSGAMAFAISVIGVLVFAALTAYDTQRIKDEYYIVAGDSDAMARASIFGALSLYLDFVNMFQFLLSLFGSRE